MKRLIGLVALVSIAGACGGDEDDGVSPREGMVVAERSLEIGGGQDVDVELVRSGAEPVRLFVPGAALPSRRTVVVRANAGIIRQSPPTVPVTIPVNSTQVQIATRNVSFATPATLSQPGPLPPMGWRYVVVHATETDTVWRIGTPATQLPPLQPGGPIRWGIPVQGSGFWALALIQDQGVADAGAPDASVDVLPDATAADAGVVADAAPAVDARPEPVGDAAPAPQLLRLSPIEGQQGSGFTLSIDGSGFRPGAVITFDGRQLETTLTDTGVTAMVPADALTGVPGSVPVWVESVPGDSRTRSNVLYYTVRPAPGAPIVLGYSPDNGKPGDVVKIVGRNLSTSGALTIKDALGRDVAVGPIAASTWLGGAAESVEVTIPADLPSGAFILTNTVGSSRGQSFQVGQNLTRLEGTVLSASSEYNTTNWSIKSGGDNNIQTSWFSRNYDCATSPSCTSVPWYKVTFAGPQTVARIAMRGNREYASGYDYLAGKFEVLGEGDAVLWGGTYDLPEPDRDLDIALPVPVAGARAVKFTSTKDESIEPGFAELEVFGP